MTAAAENTNHHEGRRQTLFLVLAGVFIGNALLAELIGGKLFQVPTPWHTFTLSCGIVLWPVVFIFTDIINEYFGRPGVRKMSFLAATIIAYSFIALTAAGAVPAASFSPVDDASFSRVFTQSQWIIVGSIAAFLLAQLIDVSVFWFIRRSTGHRFLWLRATGSTLVSQLIDTFVVGFIGLHLPTYFGRSGPNFGEFVNAGFSGYLFKFLIALSVTPLLYIVHRIVDRYLGKTEAERLIEATALTEHADDAHLRVKG
jgi:queuosine precursor transporter